MDLGYAQAVEAAVYASKDYCEQCLNDGLQWKLTAFDTIQDAVDNVPDIAGVWTVGVDGGDTEAMVYQENVVLRSGIRLIGSGAETSVIDGNDSGPVLTLDGVTHVDITGLTMTGGGADANDAGILVTGASNNVEITYNIIGGLSGPAVKPVALRLVWEAANEVRIPVVGIGGIMTPEDALEFIIAGARAVQVGTANFVNPNALVEIIDGIEAYLVRNGFQHIDDLVGSLRTS